SKRSGALAVMMPKCSRTLVPVEARPRRTGSARLDTRRARVLFSGHHATRGCVMSEPVGRLNRRQLLQGASVLGLGWALVPGLARAQKKTVKLAFIGPLTGGTASNGLGGRNSFRSEERRVGKERRRPKSEESG